MQECKNAGMQYLLYTCYERWQGFDYTHCKDMYTCDFTCIRQNINIFRADHFSNFYAVRRNPYLRILKLHTYVCSLTFSTVFFRAMDVDLCPIKLN